MDSRWFKEQQRLAGVTSEDIAHIIGRSRTTVSHILNGKQQMSLQWARAFAQALKVDLPTVLEKAGVVEERVLRGTASAFSESDVVQYEIAPQATTRLEKAVASLRDGRTWVETWQVKSSAMNLAGLLWGDILLVDTQTSAFSSGDTVIADIFLNARGYSVRVLRRFEAPVLIPANPDDHKVHVVDAENVVIRGKVIACLRALDE